MLGQSIQVTLQRYSGRHGVVGFITAQKLLGLKTGSALIDKLDTHTETTMQLIGETPRLQAGVLFLVVQRERQTDHHKVGLPIVKQLPDYLESLLARRRYKNGQRPGLACDRVADRHAYFPGTVIEGQHGGVRHGPRRRPA